MYDLRIIAVVLSRLVLNTPFCLFATSRAPCAGWRVLLRDGAVLVFVEALEDDREQHLELLDERVVALSIYLSIYLSRACPPLEAWS